VTSLVGLIDMDGSGVNQLFKLLRNGLHVQYSSFLQTRRLKSLRISDAGRKLVANATNKGQLEEVKISEIISKCDRIVVSYIHWLNSDIDKRDLAYVYGQIANRAEDKEAHIIHTGIHGLGLMDWLASVLQQNSGKKRLFYLPPARIFRGRVPVGGPPINTQARPIISVLAGRSQLFPGLSYIEAEAATLTQLLCEAALYAAAIETGLILYRRYGILHSENLHNFVGKSRISWRGKMGSSLLVLLCELEESEIQKSMIAEAIARVLRESDKTVRDLLTKHLSPKKQGRILLLNATPQIVEKISRKFKVLYLTKSEIGSKRMQARIDAAVVASPDAETLGLLKNLINEEGIIIDLSTLRLIRPEK